MDLPPYEDYESLETKLRSTIECVVPLFPARVCLWGIHRETEGFGQE